MAKPLIVIAITFMTLISCYSSIRFIIDSKSLTTLPNSRIVN